MWFFEDFRGCGRFWLSNILIHRTTELGRLEGCYAHLENSVGFLDPIGFDCDTEHHTPN
jgi:hypothetical protein